MRAVTIHDDHSLTVEDHPDPTPGGGECLVRVRAAGLNGADIHQRGGNYPAPPIQTHPGAAAPLGQTATQYSEVDPTWKPPGQ
jgi:NADPH:quinone reductase-like Zn-dependent oxidoreductase